MHFQRQGIRGSGDRARRPEGRRARHLSLGAAGLLLAGAGWIAVTAVLARDELTAAQQELAGLRNPAAEASLSGAERADALGPRLESAAGHAARAHSLTSGPAWFLAAHVPVLGDPLRTVRGAALAADRVTGEVLPPLARLAARVGGPARGAAGQVDLAALREATGELDAAARTAALTRAEAARLPRRTWLPAADRARAELSGQLDRLVPATADAAAAARMFPGMMGERGQRRYLVVFQNSAEARGTGGLPGAFAVLTADRGRLAFEHFGNDGEMAHARAEVDLGPEFDDAYGQNQPTTMWVNGNLSPHFPYAARIWSDAWQRHSGRRLDGVVALDPSAMAGLLAATGPARLPDGTTVSSANVVDLTLRGSYAAYADTARRKSFFLSVAEATAGQLIAAGADSRRLPLLLSALHKEVTGGRVLVWSAHPDEQAQLERRHFTGSVPGGRAPFAGLVVNNAAGSKLDYYLDRRLQWTAKGCGGPRGREVTVEVALTNRAPGAGLPPYVTQRVDEPGHPTRPGDNRLLVSYLATAGAQLTGVTLDGRPALVSTAAERGHPMFTFDVELPAGTTRRITLHLTEPSTTRPPTVLQQPLVRPLRTAVRVGEGCGG